MPSKIVLPPCVLASRPEATMSLMIVRDVSEHTQLAVHHSGRLKLFRNPSEIFKVHKSISSTPGSLSLWLGPLSWPSRGALISPYHNQDPELSVLQTSVMYTASLGHSSFYKVLSYTPPLLINLWYLCLCYSGSASQSPCFCLCLHFFPLNDWVFVLFCKESAKSPKLPK